MADLTQALRQRRHRARSRAGLIVLQIEANEVDLVETLLEAGLLAPAAINNRAAVAAAVERALALWAEMVTRHDMV